MTREKTRPNEAAPELISLRQAERDYGVPRRFLTELPIKQRDKRSKLVLRADVEALIARDWRCQGCDEPLEVGRNWHLSCRAKATDAEIAADPAKAAARSERTTRVMRDHWSDQANRDAAGARTRLWAESRAAALTRFKADEGLLDAAEVAEAVGSVRWRDGISSKYVQELARKHSVGLRVPGPSGKAGSRRLYSTDDVSVIRALLKHETLDGVCPDCGTQTYNSVRCNPCDKTHRGGRLAALHEQFTRDADRYKEENGLRDLAEAAAVLDRAQTKVWSWANKLNVGERVPLAMGRSTLVLSDSDIATIRGRIDELIERSPMVGIRETTKYPEWYLKRFKTTKKFGEYNDRIAAEKGIKIGRPIELVESDARQILEFSRQGMSQRAIANAVGVSRGHVRRLLARQQGN